MKKLMFAMAIAATVGFAQADSEIGTTTDFDSFTAGDAFSIEAGVGDSQWTAPDTDGLVADTKITAYDKDAEDYDAANGDNFLALEGVQNLAKNINTEIGKGLYIDTMVKFSASEDAPTPGNEDKLVVWLKQTGDGDDATYTLMVTAGKIDTDNEKVDVAEYATNAEVEPDKWYNLKVQAFAAVDDGFIPDGGVAGFVVYIDGTAVATATLPAKGSVAEEAFNSAYADYVKSGAYSIFPSIIDNSTAGAAEVKQLVFSGSGAIDTVAAFQGDCAPDEEPTEDWVDPTDTDAIAAIEGKQAAAAYPSLAGTAVAAVDAKKLTIWAAGIGNVDFADAATGINTTAFLLNIANSSSAADIKTAEDTAKEAIKITAITFDENGKPVLTYPATYGNGKIVVEGSAQLPAEWHDKVDADKFFRTKLVLDEVAAASGE